MARISRPRLLYAFFASALVLLGLAGILLSVLESTVDPMPIEGAAAPSYAPSDRPVRDRGAPSGVAPSEVARDPTSPRNPVPRARPGLALDLALSDLPLGHVAFTTPDSMELQETKTIVLLLSLRETIEALRSAIEDDSTPGAAVVRVSEVMEAKLTGSAFETRAVTDERQPISASERNAWIWEVRPRSGGKHGLFLTLYAHLRVGDRDERKVVKVLEREIIVEVSPLQRVAFFLDANWKWISAILIPILAWLGRRWYETRHDDPADRSKAAAPLAGEQPVASRANRTLDPAELPELEARGTTREDSPHSGPVPDPPPGGPDEGSDRQRPY